MKEQSMSWSMRHTEDIPLVACVFTRACIPCSAGLAESAVASCMLRSADASGAGATRLLRL